MMSGSSRNQATEKKRMAGEALTMAVIAAWTGAFFLLMLHQWVHWLLTLAVGLVVFWGIAVAIAHLFYRSDAPMQAIAGCRWAFFWSAVVCLILLYPWDLYIGWLWLVLVPAGTLFVIFAAIFLISALAVRIR